MPTTKQRTAFKYVAEEGMTMGKAMIKAKFSPATAKKPALLTRSKGWQELLAEYDEKPIMDNVYKIALDKEDKRATLGAADMIFKLKDRYPANKLKMLGAFEYRDKLREEEKEDNKEKE